MKADKGPIYERTSESDSISEDLDYRKDVTKMKNMWKDYHNENILHGNKTKKDKKPDSKVELQLQQNIAHLETQLAKSNTSNELLYIKLQETEVQLAKARQQLEREPFKATIDDQIYKYKELSQNHTDFLKHARQNAQSINLELDNKDKEINRLLALLEERNNKLKVVTVTQEKNYDRCFEYEKNIRELEKDNRELKFNQQENINSIDYLQLNKKAEGTFMVEVEHLRADVKRLMKMLRSTAEYKDLAELADESGQITFLKDVKKKSLLDVKNRYHCRQDDDIVAEELLWVPEEAFKFAHNYKLKYNGELTDTLIEYLLFELNKIWAKRHEVLYKKVKGNCARESNMLRRQLEYNPKYDEHQAKAEIKRLKTQLKEAYTENRDAHAQRAKRNPEGIHYIQETMKINKDLARDKKRNNDQNAILKNQLSNMEKYKYKDNNQKTLFMEGANFMGNKILNEADLVLEQIKIYQNELEYREPKESGSEYSYKHDYLIQNMEDTINEFRDKIERYKNISEKDMINASNDLKKAGRARSQIIDTI